ncbi:tail fiber domain-containing protein, partial [Jeotgalibaca porci]|uniref:tail fiber domain-containing protein n=1 Tax=Jeotgalibaca porci TaxID=1868793 RepID=UPI0035A14407
TEAGDLFTIQDASGSPLKVPNLGYKLVYNGGLKATSEAETKSRTVVKPSGRPTLQQQISKTLSKIKEESSSLKDAFEEANEKITGNRGGYLTARYDENGKPYEFLVMDTEDINSATNVIRLNQEGIGFSQNGYNGPFGVAITIDGHIVADFIDTGILNAGIIQAGFNGISQGVSMTADGLKAVSASGEYSIVEEGGVSFFTKNDVKTGSIESAYKNTLGQNGVGIFVQPGRFFEVLKKNETTGLFEVFIQIPVDENIVKVPKTLSASRFNVSGTNQYIANVSNQGGVFFDTVRVSLGTGTLDAVSLAITAEPDKAIIHKPSFFAGPLTIKNASSVLGGKIFDHADTLLLGGAQGTNVGYATAEGGVMSVMRFQNGEIRAYATLNMNGSTITNQSDIRLKTNVKDAEIDPFAIIEKMRFIEFDWDMTNPYNENKPEGRYFGIEAQYAPFLAVKDIDSNYLSIDMGKQVNLNSLALQKAIRIIEELKLENEKMSNRLSELEGLVGAVNNTNLGGIE